MAIPEPRAFMHNKGAINRVFQDNEASWSSIPEVELCRSLVLVRLQGSAIVLGPERGREWERVGERGRERENERERARE